MAPPGAVLLALRPSGGAPWPTAVWDVAAIVASGGVLRAPVHALVRPPLPPADRSHVALLSAGSSK